MLEVLIVLGLLVSFAIGAGSFILGHTVAWREFESDERATERAIDPGRGAVDADITTFGEELRALESHTTGSELDCSAN